MRSASDTSNCVPDFTLPLVLGESLSLHECLAERQGAVVVFWSGVCSHCVRYDAYLNEFEERFPTLGLLVVASRAHETRDQLRKTSGSRGLRFRLLHDADRTVAHQWFVRQTPTAFLLDSAFRLIYRGSIDNFKYPQDEDYTPYLDSAAREFLVGRTPEPSETATFGCPIESVYYEMPSIPTRSS